MARTSVDEILAEISRGQTQAVYLVTGEAVLAEPMAGRLAEALAAGSEVTPQTYRRPPRLGAVLDDLRTYSLFSSAKVALVVESAVLADRGAAASLIDDCQKVLPVGDPADTLPSAQRQGAGRLLQVLHLFGLDPYTGTPEDLLAQVPDWAFQGGGGRRRGARRQSRGKRQVAELRSQLAELLQAARREELTGWAESETEDLAAVLRSGLPSGHALVLSESHVSSDHPLLIQLQERGAVLAAGRVEAGRRGGWEGLDALASELQRQTGSTIERDALAELAERTLRKSSGWGSTQSDPDSTARLAAEYQKLANLSDGAKIDLKLVQDVVEDRGQEDVWQLLDAVGSGRGREALERLQRLLRSADEANAARLSFFALLADFCRQLHAIRSLMEHRQVPAGEKSFNRFKTQLAPALQEALPDGSPSPVASLHPFRLFRAYVAASRLPLQETLDLPSLVLTTELRLKGESGDPDGALAHLINAVATPGRS